MKELEIIDTAIKIGLAAFIGGIFVTINNRMTISREIKRETAARRWSLLQEVSEKLETILFEVASLCHKLEEPVDPEWSDGNPEGILWDKYLLMVSGLKEKQLQIQQLEGKLLLFYPVDITSPMVKLRSLIQELSEVSPPHPSADDSTREPERILNEIEETKFGLYAQLAKSRGR